MRVLFVTSTRIGDAVLSSGLLRHLIDAHPGAAVTVACGPAAAPLFAAVPGLTRVIAMPKAALAGHWRRLWRACAGTFWDRIVDLRGSPLTWLLLHRRRWAWSSMKTREHRVVQLSRLLGIDPPARPHLYLAPEHVAEAARLVPAGPPVLALGPVANWPGKEWPVERFVDLARRLTAAGAPLAGGRVMVLAAPFERARAQPLFDAFPDAIDLAAGAGLLTSAACLARARLYAGNDSGLMHIAAAAGTPTLGLFGPTEDIHYAPWGENCAVVRTPESVEELVPPGFDLRIGHTLMGSLSADAVEAAACALLARTEKRP